MTRNVHPFHGAPPAPLHFSVARRPGNGKVGCIHSDGSITFRGLRYPTIRQVPDSCRVFRADLAATLQWRRLYRAVAPPGRREG